MFSLVVTGSATVARFGGVSAPVPLVTQRFTVPLNVPVLQPEGSPGGVAVSKFSENAGTSEPTAKRYCRSFAGPPASSTCSVAVTVVPHAPVATGPDGPPGIG